MSCRIHVLRLREHPTECVNELDAINAGLANVRLSADRLSARLEDLKVESKRRQGLEERLRSIVSAIGQPAAVFIFRPTVRAPAPPKQPSVTPSFSFSRWRVG
eukprot:scaffold265228_cov13-Prasinocladus_malaysianus.AAC.1